MPDAILFFGIVFSGLAGWIYFHREQTPRFRRRQVLTGAQVEVFALLRSALPDCVVAPRVAVAALLEPTGPGAARRCGYRKLEGQRVDFAIFDAELRLIAVVDIAQRSRQTRKEAERARYFSKAGIPAIRLRAGQLPSEIRIRDAVFRSADRDRARASSGDALEYRPTPAPWRNTLNAHI